MTAAQEWLNANEGAYGQLDAAERQAIYDFTFLWSLFEARVVGFDASIPAMALRVTAAAAPGGIDGAPFLEALDFFRNRYFVNGAFGDLFDGLRFQGKNGGRAEVEAALSDKETGGAETLLALLIIVYRLRNNLLHGNKWVLEFKDQLGNFTEASAVLMRAIELFRAKGMTDET